MAPLVGVQVLNWSIEHLLSGSCFNRLRVAVGFTSFAIIICVVGCFLQRFKDWRDPFMFC